MWDEVPAGCTGCPSGFQIMWHAPTRLYLCDTCRGLWVDWVVYPCRTEDYPECLTRIDKLVKERDEAANA